MFSNSDATAVISPFADADPFAYGDQTVVQLQAQPFEVQDAFGTVVTMPIDTARRPVAVADAPAALETVFAEEDPMARLERKVDAALQQIAALQRSIESLDATLARGGGNEVTETAVRSLRPAGAASTIARDDRPPEFLAPPRRRLRCIAALGGSGPHRAAGATGDQAEAAG